MKTKSTSTTTKLLVLLTMLALALGVACSGGQETPEQMTERVRGALSDAGYSGITVSMRDGQPVLGGTVSSNEERDAIAALVGGLEGLSGSTNEIRVVVPEPEETAEERAAREKAAACASALSTATASNVLFATSSAALNRDARGVLDGVVSAAGTCDSFSLRLSGHADPRGEERYNQGLSDRRAAAVERYLVSQGIAADAISSTGYGESRTLGGGLDADRRVEVSSGG